MASNLKTLFTEHPEAVGETYTEHLGVAFRYSMRLLGASGAAFMHALLPFTFKTTASTTIKAMYADMTRRGATDALPGQAQPIAAAE